MLLTIKELRVLAGVELLLFERQQKLNLMSLINRASHNKGLIEIPNFAGATSLIVIDGSKTTQAMSESGEMIDIPVPLGAILAKPSSKGWSIDTLYADDPMACIYLLGGALANWGEITPGASVTPAATSVIKRYWNDYKDDKSLITQGEASPDDALKRAFGMSKQTDERDAYLNATYLNPPNNSIGPMKAAGASIITKIAGGDKEKIKIITKTIDYTIAGDFMSAYMDEKRTGNK